MTDNDIIKTLECCSVEGMECSQCPNKDIGIGCITLTLTNALDLIKRQEAELEDLREIVFMDRSEAIKNLKAEARREFVERLNGKLDISACGYSTEEIVSDIENTINNLLKEMEGK